MPGMHVCEKYSNFINSGVVQVNLKSQIFEV